MVKTFPDESSGREQDPRRVRRQRIDFGDQIRTLLFRNASMQHEGFQTVFLQRAPDAFEMVGAFRQHQYLATLFDGALRLIGYCGRAFLVLSQGPKYVLNPGVVWYWRWLGKGSWNDLEIMRCAGRRCRRMSNRPTLHEDDWLLAVPSDRCCSESEDVACFDTFEDGVERDRADMVALVHDDLTVVLDQGINLALA